MAGFSELLFGAMILNLYYEQQKVRHRALMMKLVLQYN